MTAKEKVLKQVRNSLVTLGNVIIPNQFTVPSPKFHYELSNLLLNESNKRLNIIAPRGTAKTTFVSVLLTIHHIFLSGMPGKRVVLISSRTQSHAINVLRTIKNIFEYSEPFIGLFGYWGVHKAKVWREDFINFPQFAIVCRGTGNMVRGLNIDGQRPTLAVVDDPEDENNTVTMESMDKNFDWLQGAVVPALDAHRGRAVVIGTPLHERCIVMRLEKMKSWISRHYSYIYDANNEPVYMFTKEMQENPTGLKSIWPEMKTISTLITELKDLRNAGRASIFHKERLCWVTGDEDTLVEEKDLQYWKGEIEVVNREEAYLILKEINKELLPEPKRIAVVIFGGIDPASSESQQADYSVGCYLGVDEHLNRYFLPFFRVRQKPMQLADTILRKDSEYKPIRTKIENVGFQEMLKQYMETQRYIPGLKSQGKETKPRTSKVKRLYGLQPLFAAKKMYLNADDPMTREFEKELLSYPKSSHDDMLDATYYASYKNYPPMHMANEKQLKKDGYIEEDSLDWKIL